MREGDRGASVVIEAPARLHFGMLDLRGELGRRFGGIGTAIETPSLQLEATFSDALAASGPDADRALDFANRFLRHHELEPRVHLAIHRAIPAHAGLGSGTQLALSVARSLAELFGLPADVASLASAVGRAERSAVGTWSFAHGGFILEGGRLPGEHGPAPLLARLTMPSHWRCVLALPPISKPMTGDAERRAFTELPPPPRAEVERVAHLVLMSLLPALVAADIRAFGAALTEVQCMNGRWFAPAQGGLFAPGPTASLVRAFGDWGASGVGQSSWGPAVYAIVEDAASADALVKQAEASVEPDIALMVTTFDDRGARVSRPPARGESR
jgi:beta-ribofuranosylaminobenzene 5'-phosphate synthase